MANGRIPSSSKRPAAARKAPFVVSTNISSYDRLDPFAAFNALRTLLTTLPSSPSSKAQRQHKILSATEHTLSLGLLNIIEPFIGLLPSKPTITRQPTEILDTITSNIDTKRDLLNLALTCKRMHDVIFPRHWEYRVVRAKVSALRVWKHFIVHRGLAANVRRLEILDERDAGAEFIPQGIIGTDSDVESTDDELDIHTKQGTLLLSALQRMTGLKSFTWSCNHSLVSVDSIWPTLLRCQTLTHVDINDNAIFLPDGDSSSDTEGETDENSTGPQCIKNTQQILPKLTSMSLRSPPKSTYKITKHPKLNRVSGMLTHCPNISSLHIGYANRRQPGFFQPAAEEFLLYGRWNSLSAVTLSNLRCSLDALGAFLAAHNMLETIHLDVSEIRGNQNTTNELFLPPGSLPYLREIKGTKDIVNAVISCPMDEQNAEAAKRPLEVIKGVRLSGGERDRTFLQQVKKFAPNVTRFELNGWNEMEDVKKLIESAPKLNWLDLGKRDSTQRSVFASNLNEWINLLSLLPELTVLHGLRFFYEVPAGVLNVSDRSKVRKNDEISSMLAWKCPKIRRLDHWEENSGKIIVLNRDGDKVKYEVRRTKLW